VTDLACEYVPWKNGITHSGVLEASKWFHDNIGRQMVMFANEYGTDNIFITGHSLGGSVAAITTILLNDYLSEQKTWPLTASGKKLNVHCYAFGSPPVATMEIIERYLDCIDMFIYGEDVVPRLSYGSVLDFQALLVFAAEVTRKLHLVQDVSPAIIARIDECRTAIRLQKSKLNPKLFIPGRIHHLIRLRAPNNQKYTVIDDTTADRFEEVKIRKRMFSNHIPPAYEEAIEDAYCTLLQMEMEAYPNQLELSKIESKESSVLSLEEESPILGLEEGTFVLDLKEESHVLSLKENASALGLKEEASVLGLKVESSALGLKEESSALGLKEESSVLSLEERTSVLTLEEESSVISTCSETSPLDTTDSTLS